MIDETNRNTAQASALCEELGRSGVRHAVLSPGSRSSPVALALDREPQIELTVVLDERSAGFVALGLALATGSPAVVACTSGSAAANLHPAVAEADLAGVPLIVLTSDRPPELREIGAGQTIDQIKLYGSAVRWFCEAGSHDADDAGLLHYRAIGCRAAAEATRGRGPVHLNLPWRDPLGPEPVAGAVTAGDPLARGGRDGSRPLTASISAREPHDPLIEALAEALARADRPLFVAGRETREGVAAAAAHLASAAGAPILAEPTSGLRIGPDVGTGTVGAYDLILREPPAALDPDLVIRVGDMPTSKPLRAWLARPGAADQIVISPPGRWNEPTRRAGAIVDAEPATTLSALAASCGDGEAGRRREWAESWSAAEAAAQAAIDGALAGPGRLSQPALARSFGAALAGGEQGLLASSMPIRDAEAFMSCRTADAQLFSNRGANGIDGLVSTACGLARGAGRPTWALLGDLATVYDMGGLAAVAGLPSSSPLRLVVADNGGGRIFEFLPQAGQVDAEQFERLFTTPANLDFERLAALFGLAYAELTSAAELTSVPREGNVLVHAHLDPSGNVDLHRSLAAAVADAVAAALA